MLTDEISIIRKLSTEPQKTEKEDEKEIEKQGQEQKTVINSVDINQTV